MVKRILTGVVGGALYLGLGLLGGFWLALCFGFLLIWGVFEFQRLCRAKDYHFHAEIPASIGLLLLFAAAFVVLSANTLDALRMGETYLAIALVLLVLSSALASLLRGNIQGAATETAVAIFAGVYLPFPLAYMLLIRGLPGPDGLFYFFLLTVVIWAGDTAAYFIGSAWGRRRLASTISPNKSVEGSLAGLAASLLSAFVYAWAWGRSPWIPAVMGLAAGLAGQCGDLFESLLKRDFGVKDSGRLLPGHGGVLDRFDSFILAAPVFYYLVILFSR